MEKIKFLIAMACSCVAAMFELYWPIIVFTSIALAFDFVTGIIAAKMTGEGWNSDKARKGVSKKGTMLLMLGFGVFLDYLIPMAVKHVGFEIHISHLLFSSIIGFYIIFTECISVCENFYKISPNSFPKWIIRLLTVGKEQLDKLGDTVEGVTEHDEPADHW